MKAEPPEKALNTLGQTKTMGQRQCRYNNSVVIAEVYYIVDGNKSIVVR